MGLGVGTQLIKVVLFIFNFLWFLFGIVMVIAGAFIYTQSGKYIETLKNIEVPQFAIFLMIVGFVTIIISFCGCCGAIQESQCLSLTYSALLFLIIIVQVTVAVLIFVNLQEDKIKEPINKSIEKVFNDKTFKAEVDALQANLKCCGSTGPDFWTDIPDSCCKADKPCKTEGYFEEGCTQKLVDFLLEYKNILAYIALGFAVVELIALIFSCVLVKNMD
ncbi:leukocyte surface antigen CD53-like [Culicoides brevitarsis]|uniref:leukocyte surface antigen CD53-like n=1 Tax=Culicoides brevitarsis TaxID=469753 RepID=UPI00307B217C